MEAGVPALWGEGGEVSLFSLEQKHLQRGLAVVPSAYREVFEEPEHVTVVESTKVKDSEH